MKGNHIICIPTLHYPPVLGGFEVFLENIAERVGKHTEAYVLTGRVKDTPLSERKGLLTVLRKFSLYPLVDLSRSSYIYIFTTLTFLFFGTLYIVKTKKVTLLHGNGFFNGIICMLVHKITSVPFVMTIQSADFTIYHPEVRSGLFIKLQACVERIVYKNASVCHAVSNDLCKHYKNQGIVSCIMVPNGVETELFHPINDKERNSIRKKIGVPEDKKIAVNVSRLEHKNGVHDTIEALAFMADVHLVVVGDGSYREKLEKQAQTLGLEERLHFLGAIKRSEVGEIVASADVFVRTPLSEGFGIVFLEAMAAGVPVVATPEGGITDFIREGETGFFAETGNPESISGALQRVFEGTELVRQVITNAKKLVETEYSWDIVASRIEKEVYKL